MYAQRKSLSWTLQQLFGAPCQLKGWTCWTNNRWLCKYYDIHQNASYVKIHLWSLISDLLSCHSSKYILDLKIFLSCYICNCWALFALRAFTNNADEKTLIYREACYVCNLALLAGTPPVPETQEHPSCVNIACAVIASNKVNSRNIVNCCNSWKVNWGC